jgi:hypothetical protein
MIPINSSNALAALRVDVPELADELGAQEGEWPEWSAPLHLIYGVVFQPC